MATIKQKARKTFAAAGGFTFGALGGAAIYSVLGVLVHFAGYLDEAKLGDDYSLAHRFETAYCINTPESHRYHTLEYYDSVRQEQVTKRERYTTSPYITYPVIGMYGVLMSAMALGCATRGPRDEHTR